VTISHPQAIKLIAALVLIVAIGCVSIMLARAIGGVSIAWLIGFVTAVIFGVMDRVLLKWIKR
jgi:hypothetical protein